MFEDLKKEITEEYKEGTRIDDSITIEYFVLGILEVGRDIVERNALFKILSEKSGVKITTLREIYNAENRKRNNIMSRKNPIPAKYLEFSNEVLGLLASQNPDNKNKAIEKISSKFLEENYVVSIRSTKSEEMWVYQEGVYIPHGETYVMEFARLILGYAYEPRIVYNLVAKIRSDTFVDQDLFFNQQSESPYLIPVLNGILDLKIKELLPFSPQKYFFNKINANYKPGSKCLNIKRFIGSLVSTEKDLLVLQEYFGFCLVKEYTYKKGLMLEGNGDNGKSALMRLFRKFIGFENIIGVNLQTMSDDKFVLSEFHNKLVNISADLSSSDVNDTSRFRELTGSDSISANRKFLSPINFVNYAKMIFLANELPIPRDMIDAFFNRWIIIRFPYKFLSKEFLDPSNEFHKLKDENVVDKLFTEDEFSGFLNWILEGLHRLEEARDFSKAPSLVEVKNEWLRKSNSFVSFAMDELEESDDTYILGSELRKAYTFYCKLHSLKPVSDRVIKTYITKELGASDSRPYHGGVQKRSYFGVAFKNGMVLNEDNNLFSVFSSQKVLSKGLVDSEAGFKSSNVVPPVSPTNNPAQNLLIEEEALVFEGAVHFNNSKGLISDEEFKVITDEYEKDLKDDLIDYFNKVDGLVAVEVLLRDLALNEVELDELLRKGFLFEPKPGYLRLTE